MERAAAPIRTPALLHALLHPLAESSNSRKPPYKILHGSGLRPLSRPGFGLRGAKCEHNMLWG